MKLSKTIDKMVSRRVNTIKTILRPSNLPKLFGLLVLLAALFYVYTTYLKEGFEGQASDPYETSPDKFNTDVLGGSGKKLVLFYAGWCGHCKELKPAWDSSAKELNNGDSKEYKLWKVNVGGNESPNDATPSQEELGKKYQIKGYPTILIFENGKLVNEYEGPRTAEGFSAALA